jgi:hypothetical protein
VAAAKTNRIHLKYLIFAFPKNMPYVILSAAAPIEFMHPSSPRLSFQITNSLPKNPPGREFAIEHFSYGGHFLYL